MAARTLVFPDKNDVSSYDIPNWITFYSSNYSTWASKRLPSAVASNPNLIIGLPYPNNFNTLSNILYTNSPSIQMRGVENLLKGGAKPDLGNVNSDPLGSLSGRSQTGVQGPGTLMGLIEPQLENLRASGEMFESFLTGGNVFRFDHMETVLKPGCRRVHSFEFNLISKTLNSAKLASKIALAFQANAHPGAFTKSIYTMNHPDIWIFGIGNQVGAFNVHMDGQGLTSVLTRVDINRSPIQNIPYTLIDGESQDGLAYPLGINIKLSFTELEPALNAGTADDIDWLMVRSGKEMSTG